jgi:hypothetical protein
MAHSTILPKKTLGSFHNATQFDAGNVKQKGFTTSKLTGLLLKDLPVDFKIPHLTPQNIPLNIKFYIRNSTLGWIQFFQGKFVSKCGQTFNRISSIVAFLKG